MGKKLKDISPKDAVIAQSSDTGRENTKSADKKKGFDNRSKAPQNLSDNKTEVSQESVQHSSESQENKIDYNQKEAALIIVGFPAKRE